MIDQNVRLAAAGDMAAFGELYRQYYRRVFSLCLRMTRNVSRAEDLTQDVFIQLCRKLKTFRGEASFGTWLHRLTINEVLMHFRKPAVRAERTKADGTPLIQVVPGTANPLRMSLVDRISLERAIAQLPPGYRTVFILHDVEGYEHDEISRILGCAVGTSKSQLHKARMRLRSLLTKRTLDRNSPGNLRARTRTLSLQQQMACGV
jgi:RNA polymerase sigma-70 factor (ECF subfamily)